MHRCWYNRKSKHHFKSDAGYKQQQLDAGSNIAKAQLNLQFKPWFKPIESSSDEEDATITFHGMKINGTSMVKVLFRANPKPSEGQWIIGNTRIPIGKWAYFIFSNNYAGRADWNNSQNW